MMPHAFVIMQIGNPELEELCKKVIFPSIRACGLEPRRDRHNEGGAEAIAPFKSRFSRYPR